MVASKIRRHVMTMCLVSRITTFSPGAACFLTIQSPSATRFVLSGFVWPFPRPTMLQLLDRGRIIHHQCQLRSHSKAQDIPVYCLGNSGRDSQYITPTHPHGIQPHGHYNIAFTLAILTYGVLSIHCTALFDSCVVPSGLSFTIFLPCRR